MKNFNWTCAYCNQPTTITEPNFSNGYELVKTSRSEMRYVAVEHTAIACPNPDCKKLSLSISLRKYGSTSMRAKTILSKHETWQLLPHSLAKPQPDYIPEAIREDYQEACAILKLSPKASATLSRRCLQGMVRDFWNIPKGRRGNLGAELNFIKDEIDSDTFDSITVIRETGDIGAHMEKDVNFVVDVEPDEAELLIELIEMLFANWYIAKQKRIDRNKKVREQSAKKLAEKKQAKSASNQSGNDEPAT